MNVKQLKAALNKLGNSEEVLNTELQVKVWTHKDLINKKYLWLSGIVKHSDNTIVLL